MLRGAYNLWLELILFKNPKTKSRDTVPLNSLIFIVLCTLAYCSLFEGKPVLQFCSPKKVTRLPVRYSVTRFLTLDTVPLNSLIFIVLCTLAYCSLFEGKPVLQLCSPTKVTRLPIGTVSRDFRLWTLYL